MRCRNNTENLNPRVSKMVKQWYYQNVQYVVVKNQGLSQIKKQNDY